MQLFWMNNRPRQAYCIIRSSQTQVEHPFSAGCYFYTQKRVEIDPFNNKRKDDTYEN